MPETGKEFAQNRQIAPQKAQPASETRPQATDLSNMVYDFCVIGGGIV